MGVPLIHGSAESPVPKVISRLVTDHPPRAAPNRVIRQYGYDSRRCVGLCRKDRRSSRESIYLCVNALPRTSPFNSLLSWSTSSWLLLLPLLLCGSRVISTFSNAWMGQADDGRMCVSRMKEIPFNFSNARSLWSHLYLIADMITWRKEQQCCQTVSEDLTRSGRGNRQLLASSIATRS